MFDNIHKHLEQSAAHFETLAQYQQEATNQINALIERVNILTVEMDKQIQFQHWFFAEMNRPDDEPFTPFVPLERDTQKSQLTVVK